MLLGILILACLSCIYNYFYKIACDESPDYLNAYSLDKLLKHHKHHIKKIRNSERLVSVMQLTAVFVSILAIVRIFCSLVFVIQCIKFFIKYALGTNLIIFDQSQLQVSPCITTSEFLYKVLFVAPSAGAFRVVYNILKYSAGKSGTPKYSWADRGSILLLNIILGGSFWNLAVCAIIADQLLQVASMHKKSAILAIMRARIITLMFTDFNLSLSRVSHLRIYKKHGKYEFNPRDLFWQDLKRITLVKCFSSKYIMHYGLAVYPEQGKNLIANLITHTPLPGVSSWRINSGTKPSFATGNAIFSGSFKETSFFAEPKLRAIGLTDHNAGWLYFKIALLEQLSTNGVVIKTPQSNNTILWLNRYQFALQNSTSFSNQALQLERAIHEKLVLADKTTLKLLRLELEQIQHAGIDACSPQLLTLLGEANLYSESLQDMLDQL